MKIIFAQGNPEPKYDTTRHNIGFSVLDAMATKLEAGWSNKPKFHAQIAQVSVNGEAVLLVKPSTYYNETGVSARKLIVFYKINPANDFLVVHDDLALPFGVIRVRKSGSDAGNNGIKSLNTHIGPDYTRIRIGILNEFRAAMGDVDFVISNFRNAEARQLKKHVIPKSIELIEQFVAGNLVHTSHNTLE